MTKSTTLLLLIVSIFQLNGQITTINFEKSSFILTDSSKIVLKDFVHRFRKSRNKMDLKIIGHTDSDGDYAYNQKLSMNRAKAVRDHLISLGIKNRISMYSKGENQLLSKGISKEDHKVNRRVEILPQDRSVDNWNPYGIAKLQKRQINTREATEIIGDKGTKIRFKKNCFRIPKGDSIVDISFREYITKEDALLANLSTMTPDGKLIESKGMIHISAKSKGQPVSLKSDKPMELYFPTRTQNDSTQIFYGNRFENGVTWVAGKKPSECQEVIIDRSSDGAKRVITSRRVCTNGNGTKTVTTFWGNGVLTERRIQDSEDYAANAIALQSTRLGWINCDRFYNDNVPKIDFVVDIKQESEAKIYLVFEDINSIMPYTFAKNGEYHFKNVPQGMAVKVVGIYDADNKDECYFAHAKSLIDSSFKTRLKFKKIIKEDLKI